MIYAVGDIHGHLDKLDQALALIEADGGAEAPVVFLGDLVDRGPASCQVIDRLLEGRAAGRDWTVLLGNHDRLFLDFLEEGRIWSEHIKSGVSWLNPRMGGAVTLASYGVEASEDAPALEAARAAVPEAHQEFLRSLPRLHEVGDLLFVHAGIDPRKPLDWQDPVDLIWIRDRFLNYRDPLPWLVVHGHSAVDYPEHCGNRVNLDGGAGHGRDLIPAVIEGREVSLLTDRGRVALRP
ncbi:metallophosphoesterase [Roseovarius sp. CH_XMU1461]|uniref:metallophosphoesterase n=1 Tax=Roseovarius sp. CH_XMU1461 TaxID=3107777 RepID=UPI00300AD318